MKKFKIIFQNLPPGTLRSDVQEIIEKWLHRVTVLAINLAAPNIDMVNRQCLNFKNRLNAYVELSTQHECNALVDFYNENFAKCGGFTFRNSMGSFDTINVVHYRPHSDNSHRSRQSGNSRSQRMDNNRNFTEYNRMESAGIDDGNSEVVMDEQDNTNDLAKFENSFAYARKEYKSNNLHSDEVVSCSVGNSGESLKDKVLLTGERLAVLNGLLAEKIENDKECESLRGCVRLLEQEVRKKCSSELFMSEFESIDLERKIDMVTRQIVDKKALVQNSKQELESLKSDIERLKN